MSLHSSGAVYKWVAYLGGYDQMTFTRWDFSNMRRDEKAGILWARVDLVITKFEERKKKSPSFYYAIHQAEKGN